MSGKWKLFRFIAILVVIYIGTANSWWHYRSDDIGAGSFASRSLASLAQHTNFLWFPGWILFYVRDDGAATVWSDRLIPVLSTLFWAWIAMVGLKAVGYTRSKDRSVQLTRVAKLKFVAECAFIISIAACTTGMYLNSDRLYLSACFASCGLIVIVLVLSFYPLFVRCAKWLRGASTSA